MSTWTPLRGYVRRTLAGKPLAAVQTELETLRFMERQHGKVVLNREDEARLDHDAEQIDEAEKIEAWMIRTGAETFDRKPYEAELGDFVCATCGYYFYACQQYNERWPHEFEAAS